MPLTIHRVPERSYAAMHAILNICGEHMHRVQGMSQWYPYRDLEKYTGQLAGGDVFAVRDDNLLVGTFYLTATMRPHYTQVGWAADDDAIYLGGLGVLPHVQGSGLGTWVMEQIDAIVAESARYLRFDGVTTNAPLMRFYDRLGYERVGDIHFESRTVKGVTCFQRELDR